MTTIKKQPSPLSLVRNPIEFRLHNSTAWGTAAFLILHLYVEREAESGNFELVAEMESERDESGSATFEISETLEAQLSYHFNPANSATLGLELCPQLCKRYYVEYGFRTGPEVLHLAIVGSGTYQRLSRPLREGKTYHLLLNTTSIAVAQQLLFKHTDYAGTVTTATPDSLQVYKNRIYAVLATQLPFQELQAPAGLQVLLYENFARLSTDTVKFALLGGWEHSKYPDRKSLLPASRVLLTPLPHYLNAVEGQYLYLYLLRQAEGSEITIYTRWDDEESASVTTYLEGHNNISVYRMVLELNPVLLSGYGPGRRITEVIVDINGGEALNLTVSEPQTDYLYELYYANSLGGYDTLMCSGKGSSELEVMRETATRYLPDNYRADQGREFVYKTEGQMKRTLATGAMTKPELMAHLGIFQSRDVRLRVGEEVVPVILVTRRVSVARDGQHLYAFEFEIQHANPYSEIHPL